MKIKRLEIYGYGKWVNQTFDINDHLQLFYGKNESGKSTLQSFIRSILFGFPDKRRRKNQVNRYEPRKGDQYGGRILLTQTDMGDLWIERTNQGLFITDLTGNEQADQVMDKLLSGIDENLYDTFYAFNLQNLQELNGIGADQLNDYFLSVGTLGSDKFLALSRNLDKEAKALFKPRASNPPLNELLADYETMAQDLENKGERLATYQDLLNKEESEIKLIKELNQAIGKSEEDLQAKDRLLNRYDIYLKDQAAQRQLNALTYTEIPDQAPETVIQNQKQIDQNHLQLIQLQERESHIQAQLKQETRLDWARRHKEDRAKWRSHTQAVKEVQAKNEQLQRLIFENQDSMEQLAKRNQFYPDKIQDSQSYQAKLQEGLVFQTNLDQVQADTEEIEAQRRIYLDQRKEQQNYSMIARQQVVSLENQRMNAEERLIQATSLKDYFFGGLFCFIGVAIIIYCLTNQIGFQSLYFYLGVIIAVLGAGALIMVFSSHRQAFKEFRSNPIFEKIDQLKEKEGFAQDQARALGMEINDREERLEALKEDYQAIKNQQAHWLVELGFYPTADPEIVLKANPVKDYFEMKNKTQHYQAELGQTEVAIQTWKTALQPMIERFSMPENDPSTRQMIRFVEETEADLTEVERRAQKLEDLLADIKVNQERLKQENDKLEAERQMIFAHAGVENDQAFQACLKENQEIKELRQQRDLNQTYIAGHENALSQIENKQALMSDYDTIKRQLKELKERIEPHQQRRANLAVEISRMKEDGSYQELKQTLASKQAQIEEVFKDWGQKQLAKAIIQQTLNQGLDDPLPQMIEQASEIFATLTFNRYRQIKANKNSLRVKHNSDLLFAPHELSQGTLEQLYVALRLAFIMSAQHMVKMPIIIDDAFVNFDELRKTSMNQVLEEVAKSHQILYFTFDQQTRDSFSDQQVIDLENIGELSSDSDA
ncbi:ATP-binding protein [Eremococcus coleocola]|uniref:ATP-binding protein n=1 Tax=Eremococcus coleocola TaxID=88132 RepID=UPI00041B5F74|nr:AAA family ATPase [Eremococcus coleocola]